MTRLLVLYEFGGNCALGGVRGRKDMGVRHGS